MVRTHVLDVLETILRVPSGTLRGSELVSSLSWDSIDILDFIAEADKRFGVILNPDKITTCRCVDDLVALFQGSPGSRAA